MRGCLCEICKREVGNLRNVRQREVGRSHKNTELYRVIVPVRWGEGTSNNRLWSPKAYGLTGQLSLWAGSVLRLCVPSLAKTRLCVPRTVKPRGPHGSPVTFLSPVSVFIAVENRKWVIGNSHDRQIHVFDEHIQTKTRKGRAEKRFALSGPSSVSDYIFDQFTLVIW